MPSLGAREPPVLIAKSPNRVNTPLLLLAMERYEEGLLPRSMRLSVLSVL